MKLVFLCFFALSSLFAASTAPTQAFVYRVSSQDNMGVWQDEAISWAQYSSTTMAEPWPSPSTGYINQSAPVRKVSTESLHKNGKFQILVYFPAAVLTQKTVYIDERNANQIKSNTDGIILSDGFSRSSYYVSESVNADGSKLVQYNFNDYSGVYKRITVTTCPKNKQPTAVQCAFSVIDIQD